MVDYLLKSVIEKIMDLILEEKRNQIYHVYDHLKFTTSLLQQHFIYFAAVAFFKDRNYQHIM